MLRVISLTLILGVLNPRSQAQICNPAVAPSGLVSTYTPGLGALLEWDAVPGSIGVQLRVDLPSGAVITKRFAGFERDQFAVPDAQLTPGTYVWRVQAACSNTPPYDVTPVSAPDMFVVGGSSTCPSTVSDIDGNVYQTVEIDGKCWMQQNLRTEHYRNGDGIATGLDNAAWSTTSSGAFAIYNDVLANKDFYGLLYNWFALTDPRGLCPLGWHPASDAEFTELTDHLGGLTVAGGAMKTTGNLFEGTGLWAAPNTGATNSSGFSGLPGGMKNNSGLYESISIQGNWWTSTESAPLLAQMRRLRYLDDDVLRTTMIKYNGLSVRCLKD